MNARRLYDVLQQDGEELWHARVLQVGRQVGLGKRVALVFDQVNQLHQRYVHDGRLDYDEVGEG